MILVSLPPPDPGPMVPMVRPLPKASAVAAWGPGGLLDLLAELPGAVVVVEDEAQRLNTLPSLRSMLQNRVKLMAAGLPAPFSLSPGMPVWMDPNLVRSGGNVVHKVYGFGGASF